MQASKMSKGSASGPWVEISHFSHAGRLKDIQIMWISWTLNTSKELRTYKVLSTGWVPWLQDGEWEEVWDCWGGGVLNGEFGGKNTS